MLVRIGIIVTGLDIKTSAELWKQLIILIENYNEILLSRISISMAIFVLCDEIISTVQTIVKLVECSIFQFFVEIIKFSFLGKRKRLKKY